jgi:glycosyltransferase involved in cell wall biosynthesis
LVNLASCERLSVIICCYTSERVQLTRRAVESVCRQLAPVHEVVVVVDHNPDLLHFVEQSFDGLTVIENAEQQGLSGARNTGMRAASGTIVAFIDDDAHVDEDWSTRLLNAYADPAVVAVGGSVVPEFESGRPAWFPPELDWVVGCTYVGHRLDAGPVRNLIGANMSFRAEAVAALGGFRTDLGRTDVGGGGCEETELCIRCADLTRGKIWFEPHAVARHFVPRQRTTMRYLRRRCVGEGRSKAIVARVAGGAAGLTSERNYVLGTLPQAAGRELRSAIRGAEPAAWRRLAVICGAPLATAWGYALGSVAGRSALRNHR